MKLPVEVLVPDLRRCLSEQKSCVVSALPGSGKTTILPPLLLNEPWLNGQKIILLEPRRLAAKMAAWRIADLMKERVGETVGYRVRLENCAGAKTRLEIVTEGILSRMIQDNPELPGVGLLIFDEFHERSLQADLALTLALEVREALRPDLRIMVMSATLDTERISRMLSDAPILSCDGRLFPVETYYVGRPPPRRVENDAFTAAVIRRAWNEQDGDILVFLPGMAEIRRVESLLLLPELPQTRILPLHGTLPRETQEAAVRPDPNGLRKIVLSTSVAESSLTIEGVKIVVDSCMERISRFFPGTGMDRLVTQSASLASLDQRRGRAGRLAPGHCYRLINELDLRVIPPFTQPEILRADLTPLLLELARWGTPDPAQLRWLDPPSVSATDHARTLLSDLEAVTAEGKITARGLAMSRSGIHPRLAHMILEGQKRSFGGTACDLAALLEEGDFMRALNGESLCDLRVRLEILRRGSGSSIDRFRFDNVKRTADDLRNRFKCPLSRMPRTINDEEECGALLALAFPDRIAQKRSGAGYLMANGRGAAFSFPDGLNQEPYLVIADFDDREENGQIRLCTPVSLDALRQPLAHLIHKKSICVWDENRKRVNALRETRLGSLVLNIDTSAKPSPEEALPLLTAAVEKEGLSLFPWSPGLLQWRERITFLHRVPQFANDYPDFSDEGLLESLPFWLPEALQGKTAFSMISPDALRRTLEGLSDWKSLSRLDELAPSALEVPSGSKIKLNYDHPSGPVLPVRLQELFGWFESPKIAGGRVPVTLEMLSPAMRPVQVTRDLANFWKEGYFFVRKDLRGRYPKHYWPEDPLEAEAIRGSRKPRSS